MTACPTGIAHTYLAAEALQQAAQARGLTLKVETNGAAGVNDELTDDEIQAAECVIVAVDRSIRWRGSLASGWSMPRRGMPCATRTDCWKRPFPGKAPVYRGGHAFRTSDWKELGREYYGHLMSGISHMLPFVVAGGVMLALSLLLQHLFGRSDITTMMTNVSNAAFRMMYPRAGCVHRLQHCGPPRLYARPDGRLPGTARHNHRPPVGLDLQRVLGGHCRGLCCRSGCAASELPVPPHSAGAGSHQNRAAGPAVESAVCRCPDGHGHQSAARAFNAWLSIQLDGMQGGSRLVLGTLLGGMMATDYGGPINKAAYVSGTLALVDQQYDLMAAVMAGGMIPPLGIGLACLLFPTRFTSTERCSAPQTLLMGATFVTEGALPFALRDRCGSSLACIAGSALAGFITILLGCGCPAPHGGLFFAAGHGKPAGLSDCAGCRHSDHGPAAGHAEKAAEALIFALLFVFFSSIIQIVFA